MSQVVTNPSPKSRFQESSQNVSTHRELVGSNALQRALDFALLHYQQNLYNMHDHTNPELGRLIGTKLVGAMEFVHVFRNLAEAPNPPSPKPDYNLNPKA